MGRSGAAACWCLRLAVAVQCAGLVALYFGYSSETESDIYGVLFFDWQLDEAMAQRIDDAGALMCGVGAAWVLVVGVLPVGRAASDADAPHLHHDRHARPPVLTQPALRLARGLEWLALLWISGWFLALAVAHQIRGGPYTEWALAEHAVRFAAPLALLALGPLAAWWRRRASATTVAWIVLRLAAAATFVAHGYKAIDGYGPFVDLILLSDLRWTATGVQQSTVESVLAVIGWIDLAAAAMILSPRWRVAAVYMAIWGAVTASSRITGLSMDAWPETLLRAANCGVPLALVWWSGPAAKDGPPRTTVEDDLVPEAIDERSQ